MWVLQHSSSLNRDSSRVPDGPCRVLCVTQAGSADCRRALFIFFFLFSWVLKVRCFGSSVAPRHGRCRWGRREIFDPSDLSLSLTYFLFSSFILIFFQTLIDWLLLVLTLVEAAHARSRARCQLLFSPGLFLTRPFPWILLLSSFLCIDINIYLQVSVGDCYSFSGTWILRRRRREPLSLSFSLLVRALSVCVCVYRNVTP